jgi:hypothetical protein
MFKRAQKQRRTVLAQLPPRSLITRKSWAGAGTTASTEAFHLPFSPTQTTCRITTQRKYYGGWCMLSQTLGQARTGAHGALRGAHSQAEMRRVAGGRPKTGPPEWRRALCCATIVTEGRATDPSWEGRGRGAKAHAAAGLSPDLIVGSLQQASVNTHGKRIEARVRVRKSDVRSAPLTQSTPANGAARGGWWA